MSGHERGTDVEPMAPWSRSKRKVESPAPVEPRPAERERADEEDAQLSPLEERLSTMEWPKPPPGVRERLFDEIVARAEQNGNGTSSPERPGADGSDHRG